MKTPAPNYFAPDSVPIRIRPRSAPINRPLFIAAISAWIAWRCSGSDDWLISGVSIITCAIAVGTFATGAIRIVRDFRLRKQIALSEQVTSDHGTARQVAAAELAALGMYDADHGDMLGLDDRG